MCMMKNSFTNVEVCTSRCTVSSTVVSHHTDVVLLVIEHLELDGGVRGGKYRPRLSRWGDGDEVIHGLMGCSYVPLHSQ